MRALLVGLLVAVPCYAAGALLGAALVTALSGNRHDRSVEATMTGAFVAGPLVALVGFGCGAVVAARRARRRSRAGA